MIINSLSLSLTPVLLRERNRLPVFAVQNVMKLALRRKAVRRINPVCSDRLFRVNVI